jgi:Protein of unknown function (DUF3489)
LLFKQIRVIHVVTAVITAEGEFKMSTSITEETGTAPATAAGEKAKATKKAAAGARRAKVAPAKPKAGKKATPKKKAPRSARNDAREGSKTAAILDMLKRSGGATAKELLKATGWQPHSLRGFISGTLGKKMGLTVTSAKGEDGERSYSVKA